MTLFSYKQLFQRYNEEDRETFLNMIGKLSNHEDHDTDSLVSFYERAYTDTRTFFSEDSDFSNSEYSISQKSIKDKDI